MNKSHKTFLLFIVYLALLSITLTTRVPSHEKKREKYYTRIIQSSLLINETDSQINLNYDSDGFYLSNQNNYESQSLLTLINKSHVVSGCGFFPFRDYITGLIMQYLNMNLHVNRDMVIPLFTLVYNMLFMRFGKKELAYKYYSSKLKQTQQNDFYNYELKDDTKEYMMNSINRPIESGSHSAFYFSEEDLILAKTCGLNLDNYNMAMNLFEFILNNISRISDAFHRESMLPIVNNKEYFKKYVDYAFKHGIHVRVKEYSNVLAKEFIEEYLNYNSIIADKFKIKNEVCMMVMPVADLLKHFAPSEVGIINNSKELVRVHLTLIPDVGFGVSLNTKFNANEKLGLMINEIDRPLTIENIYLDYGLLNELHTEHYKDTQIQNWININYTFNKIDFSEKKAEVCKLIGCAGFYIDFIFKNKGIDSFSHSIRIDKNINYSLLNIFKLIHFNDTKLNSKVHVSKFKQFAKFDTDIEIKAMNSYINHIRRIDEDFLDYIKINEDLVELKSIKKEHIKNSDSIQNKINLLTIAAQKKKILNQHLKALYKEYENLLCLDLQTLKHFFLKN